MEYRPLGKTGVLISEIGIGASKFGIQGTSVIDEQNVKEIILAATSAGMNFIDLPGRFFSNPDLETFVENLRRDYNLDLHLGYKRPIAPIKVFEEEFEKCLKKTPNGRLEFFAIHGLTKLHEDEILVPHSDTNMCIDFLFEKQMEGLVEHVGISYHGRDPDKVFDRWNWDYAMVVHNPIDFRALKGEQISRNSSLGIIGMRCLKTERYYNSVKSKLFVVNPETEDFFINFRQQLLQWSLEQKTLSCALIGFRSSADVELHMALYEESQKRPKKFFNLKKLAEKSTVQVLSEGKKTKVPRCIECNYCSMFCPQKLNPSYFFQNMAKNADYEEIIRARMSKNPTAIFNCTGCGRCDSICPQLIPITKTITRSLRVWDDLPEIIKKNAALRTSDNPDYQRELSKGGKNEAGNQGTSADLEIPSDQGQPCVNDPSA